MTKVENLINFLSVNAIQTDNGIYTPNRFLGSGNKHFIGDNKEDTFIVMDSRIQEVDIEYGWYAIEFIIKYENRIFGFNYSVSESETALLEYTEYEYYTPVSLKIK